MLISVQAYYVIINSQDLQEVVHDWYFPAKYWCRPLYLQKAAFRSWKKIPDKHRFYSVCYQQLARATNAPVMARCLVYSLKHREVKVTNGTLGRSSANGNLSWLETKLIRHLLKTCCVEIFCSASKQRFTATPAQTRCLPVTLDANRSPWKPAKALAMKPIHTWLCTPVHIHCS